MRDTKKPESTKALSKLFKEECKLNASLKWEKRIKLVLTFLLPLIFAAIDFTVVLGILINSGIPNWFGAVEIRASSIFTGAEFMAIIFALLLDGSPAFLGVCSAKRDDAYSEKYESDTYSNYFKARKWMRMAVIIVFIAFFALNILIFIGGGNLNVGMICIGNAIKGEGIGLDLIKGDPPQFGLSYSYVEGLSYNPSSFIQMIIPVITSIMSYFAGSLCSFSKMKVLHSLKVRLEHQKNNLENQKENAEGKIGASLSALANQYGLDRTKYSNTRKGRKDLIEDVAVAYQRINRPFYSRYFDEMIDRLVGACGDDISQYTEKTAETMPDSVSVSSSLIKSEKEVKNKIIKVSSELMTRISTAIKSRAVEIEDYTSSI